VRRQRDAAKFRRVKTRMTPFPRPQDMLVDLSGKVVQSVVNEGWNYRGSVFREMRSQGDRLLAYSRVCL
jgi:hypothetical protein